MNHTQHHVNCQACVEAWRLAQETAANLRALALDASQRDVELTGELHGLADRIQDTYALVGTDQRGKAERT